MIKAFKRLSIRRKLMAIMLATTGSVLGLATLAMVVNEAFTLQRSTRTQLATLAEVIASSSRAPLALNDPLAALETLDALRAKGNIVYAVLRSADGRVFAEYRRDGSRPPPEFAPSERAGTPGEPDDRYYEAGSQIHLLKTVLLEWKPVGTLQIAADYGELYASLGRYSVLLLVMMLATLGLAMLIASKLQRLISQPILHLREATRRVSEKRDYSVRVASQTDDELGTLVDGFNDMLEQIQQRDAELARYNARLADEVGRRTLELQLANRELQTLVGELREEKERAEAASHAKSQFLANVSHEVRTPMNGMLGTAELLLHTQLSSRQRHLTETLVRSGKTLLGIINDILDLSKIEAGKLDLEQEDFDLHALVEHTVELFTEGAQRQGLELVCSFAPHLPTRVTGDPGRFGQVLGNLLSNAIKFTPRGEIVIRVDALGGSGPEVTVGVEVTDTGIGIAAADQARIFDAFTQTDVSIIRRHDGTGLGLTIARQLVERMGGQIGLASQPGKGTTFWFTVQLRRASGAAAPEASLRGVRVLLAGLPVSQHEALHNLLKMWHAADDHAASAAETLALAAAAAAHGQPYDALIVNDTLPDLATEDLGPHPALAGIHKLVMLGPQSEPREPPPGFCCTLERPLRARTLHRALLNCLQRGPGTELQALQPEPPALSSGRVCARVLLAEDNPINEEVARVMLEELGANVESVDDGRAAVKAFLDGGFDVIFMDGRMPVQDGIAATRQIREIERRRGTGRRIPIVALTAHAVAGDRERYLEAGMDDYISKPFTSAELLGALSRWLPERVEPVAPRSSSAAAG